MPPSRTLLLSTLKDCRLTIGRFPPFSYDASGGGGSGHLGSPGQDGRQGLHFEAAQLRIPSLAGRRARLLGIPLPPGVVIQITPLALAGELDAGCGALALRFSARFQLQLGPWYQAPDLQIDTQLQTGEVRGQRHRAQGRALTGEGDALLVGVASVAPSGDPWLDRFLGLPDEALAQLHCRLSPC